MVCGPVLSDVFFKDYIIYTSGVKIGKVSWKVTIKNNNYSNNIGLESGGLLSTIYSFEGKYNSSGVIKKKKLTPKNYKHSWKTNKVDKKMTLIFNNKKIKLIEQTPLEKEELRLNIFKINEVKDPLSSFLQIIMGSDNSLVIDGRRFYEMNAKYNDNSQKIIIGINKYSNLWADHKRNNFEKITFERKIGDFLPTKIFIYFDGRVFKLKEN